MDGSGRPRGRGGEGLGGRRRRIQGMGSAAAGRIDVGERACAASWDV